MNVFWSDGYAGTSYSALVGAMKMNKPSIYLAFGDKESLFLKTVDYYAHNQGQQVMSVLNSGENHLLRLEKFALNTIKNCCNKRHPGCLIASVLADAAGFSPKFKNKLKELVRATDAVFAEFVRRGIEAGELRSCANPDLQARVFLTALNGFILRARAGAPEEDLMNLAGEIVRILFAPA